MLMSEILRTYSSIYNLDRQFSPSSENAHILCTEAHLCTYINIIPLTHAHMHAYSLPSHPASQNMQRPPALHGHKTAEKHHILSAILTIWVYSQQASQASSVWLCNTALQLPFAYLQQNPCREHKRAHSLSSASSRKSLFKDKT